jgi:flagellar basal-body rod modification protein FlgD
MNISAAALQALSNNQGTTPTSSADMSDTFLKLLVAQLQSQSPLNPVDPTQFVGQLVQFNTLGQIIKIRELLEQVSPSASGLANLSTTHSLQGGQ